MTQKQIEILEHAIGARSKTPGYRNRFCASVDDKDVVELVELVGLGLMYGPFQTGGTVGVGYGMFYVTVKGKDILGVKESK